jgi:hypothetical protein
MTTAEITAFVMALSHEEIRRRAAEDVMGWEYHGIYLEWYAKPDGYIEEVDDWHPDTDRNQSRMVTDKVKQYARDGILGGIRGYWYSMTPLDETRAALIAHYVSKGGIE